MYEIDELLQLTRTPEFSTDRSTVLASLNELRYKGTTSLDRSARRRLGDFVECVLASAPLWKRGEGEDLCQIAGQISELLSTDLEISTRQQRWLRLRATLLYELGGVPAVASTMLQDEDVSLLILQFFRRDGAFRELNGYDLSDELPTPRDLSLDWGAIDWDVMRTARYVQSSGEQFDNPYSHVMSLIASSISLPLLATDYQALSSVFPDAFRKCDTLTYQERIT